jgi:mucin-desulfating sulfatase (N-acetylglucosamine-6-sulfatase)
MGFDGYWAAYSFNHINYNAFYDTDGPDGEPVHVSLKGQYGPEVFTGLALDYIREHAGDGQPFTLMLSWSPTHDPWVRKNVPEHCYEKFRDVKFELPENFNENPDPYMDRFFSEYFNGKASWRDDFVRGEGYNEAMRCYYAMANSIDEQFGRVVGLLDSLGIADNTIVVFTSDHGEMMTSQGRMFKMIFYDESCRIPMLVRCPGAKHGKTDVCLNTPDIAPTLLGMVGLSDSIPEEMEGRDLSFVVRGEKGIEPDFAFMQGMGHTHLWRNGFEWRAVRDKRYTYARYLRDGSELLFDRKKDPHMTRNVAGERKYAKVLETLRGGMAARMEELNDEFKPCTWYRDHWMYKNFSIKAAAHGEFGPLPPIEPVRTRE